MPYCPNTQLQDLLSKGVKSSNGHISLTSVLEVIHINAFNTLPIFAFATIALGEHKRALQSDALRGKYSDMSFPS